MQLTTNRLAFKVALVYVLVGGAWILFSDEMVEIFVKDPDQRVHFSIYKGWAYVILTGLLLYQLIDLLLRRWKREIDERHRAELESRENERIYREIFSVANEAVFMVDCETQTFLEANPAAERMYGYTREEFLRMRGPDISCDPAGTAKAIASNQTFVPMRMHRRKDGSVFSVEIHTSYFVSHGRNLHVAVMRDITQRLASEIKLKQSEERYRALFENMSQGVAYCEVIYKNGRPVDYIHVMVNPKAEDLAGLKNVVGRRMSELMPDFLTQDGGVFEMLVRVAETGVPETTEVYINSLKRWLSLSLISPKRGSFVALYDDITAQRATAKEIEQKSGLIRSLMDSIPDLIFFKDLDGRYVGCNPAFSDFTGRPIEAFVGKTDLDIFPAAVAIRFREQDAKVLAAGRPLQNEEWVNYPDGRRVLLLTLKTPWRGADGVVSGVLGISRDITSRERAEESLAQVNSLLTATLESTADGILVVNHQGQVTSFNQKFLDLWQISPELIESRDDRRLLQFVREQLADPLAFSGRVNEIYAHPESSSFEELEFRDGRVLERYSQPQRVNDEITGRVWSFRDISARKWAEKSLRESEQRFRFVTENVQIGLVVINNDRRYVFSNSAYTEILGLPSSDILGQRVADVLAPVYEEQIRPRLDRAFAGERVNFELRKNIAGADHFYSVTYEPVDKGGASPLIVVVIMDITSRKTAERQLQLQIAALTAADNAIFITSREGKIQWANPSFTQLTGYTREEVIGRNPRFLKSGQQSRAFYQEMWNTILAGNVWRGELINRRKNGTFYNEDMTITPVRGESGDVTHFVAIKLDVTERRQLDIRLQQAEKMEAIGTLAGGIAHDFNNILAAMFGYGYLLDADFEGNAEAKENIGEILKAAARAKDLVQQILTFSRQREQKREVIQLNVVVKEAMKFLRASLPSEIKIEILLADETPTVLADPTKIYQVVLNLATNALHAMEGQQGRLIVSLSEFTPDAAFVRAHPEFRLQKYVRLSVADSGYGMDEKTIKRIFEPFFTTKAVGKGTGLGLSVVHGVVQSHDGHITVESKLGAGTTFGLYFPAIEGESSATTAQRHDLLMGSGQKVLVVDDERALIIMLEKSLRRLNYQVTTTNDPREALRLFQENPQGFDLLITDLTMPEINGRELARQIHELNPNLPILLASGFNAALTGSDLKNVGIRELIEKPVSLAALAKALAAIFAPEAAGSKNGELTS